MKTKKFLVAIVLGIASLILLQTSSQAALQSNITTSRKIDSATNWVIKIRQMESSGGGMGLEEIVGADGIGTTDSNGIDVHFQKNTEYGAILLLGASDYGKQGTVGGTGAERYMNRGSQGLIGTDIKASSTGNVTGVYDLGTINDYECTAGGGTSFLSHIAPRYRDIYETSGVGKPGDATVENGVYVNRWHGSGYASFATGSSGFIRGLSSYGSFASNDDSASSGYYARASVVSAAGL